MWDNSLSPLAVVIVIDGYEVFGLFCAHGGVGANVFHGAVW